MSILLTKRLILTRVLFTKAYSSALSMLNLSLDEFKDDSRQIKLDVFQPIKILSI